MKLSPQLLSDKIFGKVSENLRRCSLQFQALTLRNRHRLRVGILHAFCELLTSSVVLRRLREDSNTLPTSSQPISRHKQKYIRNKNLHCLLPKSMATENDSENPSGSRSSSNEPITPHNDHLNAGVPGELSPPRSQGPAAEDTSLVDMTDAPETSDIVPEDSQRPGETRNGDSEKYVPGAAWTNKRAQEDYQRAMDAVVDRDFNPREFGDPLLESRS